VVQTGRRWYKWPIKKIAIAAAVAFPSPRKALRFKSRRLRSLKNLKVNWLQRRQVLTGAGEDYPLSPFSLMYDLNWAFQIALSLFDRNVVPNGYQNVLFIAFCKLIFYDTSTSPAKRGLSEPFEYAQGAQYVKGA
jgi:hypothetical protein